MKLLQENVQQENTANHTPQQPKQKKKTTGMSKKADLIFYICMMAYPVIQFCIFYVGVNFNSIMLTFQRIYLPSGAEEFVTEFVWFDNLIRTLKDMLGNSDVLVYAASNSLKVYVISFIISVPLGLFFSFAIYKKVPMAGFFRVMLYMPSILTGIVMVFIFKSFAESGWPTLLGAFFSKEALIDMFGTPYAPGLLEKLESRFGTIMFYNLWFGFGGGVLMYSNAMSGNISPEMVEAAQLEGVSAIQEFFYITFPLIFPTFSTFTVTGIAGIFTNQFGLFNFYGTEADPSLQTYGYYMYKMTYKATSKAEYPYLASMGVWLTAVAAPITFLVKYLLEKFDPTGD